MKITLTKAELLTLIQSTFSGRITDVEVASEPEQSEQPEQANQPGEAMIFADVLYKYTPTNKIACIKELRTRIPGLGLADAKYALEYPIDATIYLIGRRTLIGFGSTKI
jgi:ribosomal protein L7/L12